MCALSNVYSEGGCAGGPSRHFANGAVGNTMPTLVVVHGPDHGKSFDINGDSLVIGRDPSCDVSLRDPGISRQHARLELKGNQYILKDLGSSNGTCINGVCSVVTND